MTDFGGRLRQARERRGISVRQIAEATKISPAALEALERNDVSRLPGGIFSRAFVRSYAAEVGLDPEETLQDFVACFDAEPLPSVADAAELEQGSSYESRRRMVAALVAVALIAVVVGGAMLYVMMRSGEPPLAGVDVAAVDQPGLDADHGGSGLDDGQAPRADQPEPAAPMRADEPPVSAGAGFRLELHATGDCWLSLTIDGAPETARMLEAGERLAYTVRQLAVIEIGDAGALEYLLNGRRGRPLGGSGQVRTARIAPDNLDEYLR